MAWPCPRSLIGAESARAFCKRRVWPRCAPTLHPFVRRLQTRYSCSLYYAFAWCAEHVAAGRFLEPFPHRHEQLNRLAHTPTTLPIPAGMP
eukprot:3275470-Pleurochrysis_carterae.AAC.1